MNWIANFVRPRVKGLIGKTASTDNLWRKCSGCGEMIFHRDLIAAQNVCPQCGQHMRIGAKERFAALFDGGIHEAIPMPEVAHDPLKFRDDKRYVDRLKDARNKTGLGDSVVASKGTMEGEPLSRRRPRTFLAEGIGPRAIFPCDRP